MRKELLSFYVSVVQKKKFNWDTEKKKKKKTKQYIMWIISMKLFAFL